MRASLQAGYVLHTRPWRDNSLILEYFSRELGRVAMIAKGAKSRKTRGGSSAALLQPFTPLLCSWSGRSELKTLTDCESAGQPVPLQGRKLYSGLYLNELLMRLLQHEDPYHTLFDHYDAALGLLSQQQGEEIALRQFELRLLDELGYGFDLLSDGISGEAVDLDCWYNYHEEYGLVLASADASDRLPRYRGADLASIKRGDFSGEARRCAKRLMRQALATHLGDKPLKSRELFQHLD
ncbi:MAG: DNA repair protein RecO [Halieaceae bacterium]